MHTELGDPNKHREVNSVETIVLLAAAILALGIIVIRLKKLIALASNDSTGDSCGCGCSDCSASCSGRDIPDADKSKEKYINDLEVKL